MILTIRQAAIVLYSERKIEMPSTDDIRRMIQTVKDLNNRMAKLREELEV